MGWTPPYLRLGFFDLALDFVQDAALAQFLVGAAPGGNLPDDLATFMLGAFLHSGITGIGTDHVFVAVQQLIDLRDIGHIGRRAHHAMHQARLVIHTDMGLHAEVPLIALMRWSARFEKSGESRLTVFLSLPKEDLS